MPGGWWSRGYTTWPVRRGAGGTALISSSSTFFSIMARARSRYSSAYPENFKCCNVTSPTMHLSATLDLVCWHETVLTIGPKLGRKKCEQSLHISWLTNGEIVFAPRTFPPPMIVNVFAPDGFYFFVGSLAQKTNMFVKYY